MPVSAKASAKNTVTLPDIPAVYVSGLKAFILTTEGEIKTLSHNEAKLLLHKKQVLCCHAPYTRQKLDLQEIFPFDVLELFAFTHPATFCIPTPKGLCDILNLSQPDADEDIPFTLLDIARTLLEHIQFDPYEAKANAVDIASAMDLRGKGWAWSRFVLQACGQDYNPDIPVNSRKAMNIFKNLAEWEDEPPKPPPSHHGVSKEESQTRLSDLLQNGPHKAEARPQQKDYTAHIAQSFSPPSQSDDDPHIVLAEAGTGTGKTLGYLAPASVWAEKNQAPVWISTFTKNLQSQIARELDRLYPNPTEKDQEVAVRKGRENYLCLLNLEENTAAAETAYNPQHAVASGIMARWAATTKDGDLTGVDFPGWLTGLLGYAVTLGLADRRGECIYSACDHYKRCFSERSIRHAKNAKVVIANHALVMIQSALAGPLETLPTHTIFDEGHHLFDAADSAFSAHLTAQETRDMRRWILGGEGGKRSRARGLKHRAEDLCAGDAEAEDHLRHIIDAASQLTSDGWTRRLKNNAPQGPAEEFLLTIMKQVHARNADLNTPYSIETEAYPVDQAILPTLEALKLALTDLQKPMKNLAQHFFDKLQNDDGYLDGDTRKRLEAVGTSLERRAMLNLEAWINMLDSLKSAQQSLDFIDWIEITRIDAQAIDVGLFRHHKDPMRPFAESIKPHALGLSITSATLRDTDDDAGWQSANIMTGAQHLSNQPQNFASASPFDYAQQTQIFVINDVNKNDNKQVAKAFERLFLASGGGALGLFTAISRLQQTHEAIHKKLEENALHLYAQHVDDIDTGTLIDMFKHDPHACMLGTDATRDGVDIPGESLRLLVFDRVPWPRPTILHKARRDSFGGRAYDEMITRLKLKQAFGRLIRRSTDKGVFVMLDSGLPTRLQTAFPKDVNIQKCGLNEASETIENFLNMKK